MRIFFLLATILLLISTTNTHAQWVPFVSNIDKTSKMLGSQTWSISMYDSAWVYFANGNSITQYDGYSWTHFALNNESDVRSVYASKLNNKIFVGGIHEFGYLSPLPNGQLTYTCLSDSIPESEHSIGNIWNICETSTDIYFQGDNGIVRWTNNKASSINTFGKKLICTAVVSDVVYVGTDSGIYMIVGNALYPIQHGEQASDWYIRCLKPFKGGLLVGMMRSGLYFIDEDGIEPFHTPIDDKLKKSELFCLDVYHDNIAIGTIQDGVFVVDTRTDNVISVNENNGLSDNTILSIAFDNMGNIWAGLDHGLNYIYLNLPFSDMQKNGLSLGTGYSVLVHDDLIYLGTNRGLYVANYDAANHYLISNIRPVKNSGGQVWNLHEINGEIFCSHDKGLMLVTDETCTEIPGMTGAWNCQPILGRTNQLFVGTYQGLYIAQKDNNHWRILRKIDDSSDSYETIIQESAYIVWGYNGGSIIRLTIDKDLQIITERKVFGEADGLKEKVLSICVINNRICAETANGLYKYNHHNQLFQRAEQFEDQLSNHHGFKKIKTFGSKLLAIKNGRISIGNTGNTIGNKTTIRINELIVDMQNNFVDIFQLSDSAYIIPTNTGFALLETNKTTYQYNFHNHTFGIKQVTLTNEADSTIYVENFTRKKPTITLNYRNNSIRFDYDTDLLCQKQIRFRYRITGNEWSPIIDLKSKEYSNLHEGKYTFEVEAFSGTELYATDSFSFEILPPWYRTIWAKIGGIILLILILTLLIILDRKRIAHSKHKVIADMDEKMEAQEKIFQEERERQEQHIMQLEKEKLEFDLKHKSQEMANLMINIARKNEMLIEVKEEIGKVVSAIKAGEYRLGSQHLTSLNSRIDSNMQNDDLLKRVEEQFDIIHNNFIKKLSEQYPDLSNNEKMMCAYIKMDLSTKEMAPLMNMSVRGVETMRYRLRKKFGLEREDDMTSFINSFG